MPLAAGFAFSPAAFAPDFLLLLRRRPGFSLVESTHSFLYVFITLLFVGFAWIGCVSKDLPVRLFLDVRLSLWSASKGIIVWLP